MEGPRAESPRFIANDHPVEMCAPGGGWAACKIDARWVAMARPGVGRGRGRQQPRAAHLGGLTTTLSTYAIRDAVVGSPRYGPAESGPGVPSKAQSHVGLDPGRYTVRPHGALPRLVCRASESAAPRLRRAALAVPRVT